MCRNVSKHLHALLTLLVLTFWLGTAPKGCGTNSVKCAGMARSTAKWTKKERNSRSIPIAAIALYGAFQAVSWIASENATFVLPPQTRQSGSPAANFPSVDLSTAASTANLAKSIVGAGVLSLPSGAAKVFDAAEQQGASDHASLLCCCCIPSLAPSMQVAST